MRDIKQKFSVEQEAGGVVILKHLPGRRSHPRGVIYCWQYRVKCARCGYIRAMYHNSIIVRIRRNTRTCFSCARADFVRAAQEGKTEPLSFGYDEWVDPPWPVPSHVR